MREGIPDDVRERAEEDGERRPCERARLEARSIAQEWFDLRSQPLGKQFGQRPRQRWEADWSALSLRTGLMLTREAANTVYRLLVTVERTDGTKLTALPEAVTSEAITVRVLVKETATVEKHTISIDQIRRIQKKTGMGLRILKGVGIGVGVCTGVVLVAGAAAG